LGENPVSGLRGGVNVIIFNVFLGKCKFHVSGLRGGVIVIIFNVFGGGM
jgi:hypothetical protein